MTCLVSILCAFLSFSTMANNFCFNSFCIQIQCTEDCSKKPLFSHILEFMNDEMKAGYALHIMQPYINDPNIQTLHNCQASTEIVSALVFPGRRVAWTRASVVKTRTWTRKSARRLAWTRAARPRPAAASPHHPTIAHYRAHT